MFHENLQGRGKTMYKKSVKTAPPIVPLWSSWTHAHTLNAFYYYALIKDASVRSESNYTHPADEILLT